MCQEISLTQQEAHDWTPMQKEHIQEVEMWTGYIEGIAHLELKLARDIKGNKNFYCYVTNKRINKEKVCPLLHGLDNLVTVSADKAEVLSSFALVFTNTVSHVFVPRDRFQGGEELPVVEEDWARDLLRNLNP